MNDHGAVLYSDVPAAKLLAAFESTVAALGYRPVADDGDVAVRTWTSAERAQAGVAVGLPKSLALGLARKLARLLGSPVRVFTASLVFRGSSYDCLVDDLTVRTDGASSVGRWGTDMTGEYGQNWDDVCDGKPYFAVSALLEDAVESVLPRGVQARHGLRAPPSLGSARLDAIATQIRFADRAALTTMAGRLCVRVSNDGTTATSFLDPAEAEALRVLVT